MDPPSRRWRSHCRRCSGAGSNATPMLGHTPWVVSPEYGVSADATVTPGPALRSLRACSRPTIPRRDVRP